MLVKYLLSLRDLKYSIITSHLDSFLIKGNPLLSFRPFRTQSTLESPNVQGIPEPLSEGVKIILMLI